LAELTKIGIKVFKYLDHDKMDGSRVDMPNS